MEILGEKVSDSPQPTLLRCYRTFCNLDAVARLLVCHVSLFPFWDTDVVGNFPITKCNKIPAQDTGDTIVNYSAFLETALAMAQEMHDYSLNSIIACQTGKILVLMIQELYNGPAILFLINNANEFIGGFAF